MDDQKLNNSIKKLILPVIEENALNLVEIALKGGSGQQILRIFVDADAGITLDQCTKLSREIADLLDTNDTILTKYRLEVSSPGLDRALKTQKDFNKNIGRQLKINYQLGDEGKTITSTGVIKNTTEDEVIINNKKQQIKIDYSNIILAKILPKW